MLWLKATCKGFLGKGNFSCLQNPVSFQHSSGSLGDLIPSVGHQQYLQLNCILRFASPAPGKELINNWRAEADREKVLCTGSMDFSLFHGRCMSVNWTQESATENHTLTPALLRDSLGPRIQLDNSTLESCGGQAEGHRNLWGWLNPMCISFRAASLSFNPAWRNQCSPSWVKLDIKQSPKIQVEATKNLPNMQYHKPKHFTTNVLADFSLLHWAAGWIYSSDFYNFLLKKLFDLFHWGFIHSTLLSWFFLLSSLRTW